MLLVAMTVATLLVDATACSNWAMNNAYRLSVRTMDLGGLPILDWGVATHPVGEPMQHNNAPARYGFVAFVPDLDVLPPGVLRPELDHFLSGGINTAGLSCDGQTVSGHALDLFIRLPDGTGFTGTHTHTHTQDTHTQTHTSAHAHACMHCLRTSGCSVVSNTRHLRGHAMMSHW